MRRYCSREIGFKPLTIKEVDHDVELDGTRTDTDKVCIQVVSEIEHQFLPRESARIEGGEIFGWCIYSS